MQNTVRLLLNIPSILLVLSLALSSSVANAEQKGVADVDRLFVKAVFVDQGSVLKRFMPRAQGRATKIRKPTSHITVVLAEV